MISVGAVHPESSRLVRLKDSDLQLLSDVSFIAPAVLIGELGKLDPCSVHCGRGANVCDDKGSNPFITSRCEASRTTPVSCWSPLVSPCSELALARNSADMSGVLDASLRYRRDYGERQLQRFTAAVKSSEHYAQSPCQSNGQSGLFARLKDRQAKSSRVCGRLQPCCGPTHHILCRVGVFLHIGHPCWLR
jgi:hypothetical protein